MRGVCGPRKNPRRAALLGSLFFALVCAFGIAECDGMYGKLGGADETRTLMPGDPEFESVLKPLAGIWYSYYAGTGRLDGYRIGQWWNFDGDPGSAGGLMEGKTALFPDMERKTYTAQSGNNTPGVNDYFVFYDDTVYGEGDDGTGGMGGWGADLSRYRYIGIVRAVNIFNGDKNRGALIIEYLNGCAPGWLDKWPQSANGKRPFFGVYFRVLAEGRAQMANAVDLAALYAGKAYYTETGTLEEAIALNTIESEAEFISWGVVIPQERER
jgi:hypothetical protein